MQKMANESKRDSEINNLKMKELENEHDLKTKELEIKMK